MLSLVHGTPTSAGDDDDEAIHLLLLPWIWRAEGVEMKGVTERVRA